MVAAIAQGLACLLKDVTVSVPWQRVQRQHWLFSLQLFSIPAAQEIWGLGAPSLGSVPDGYVIRFGLAGPQAAGVSGASETVVEADVSPPSRRETCWGAAPPSLVTTSPPGRGVGTVWAARPPG